MRTVLSGVAAAFAVTQDWGSGLQATVTLTNRQSAAVADWVLEFDYTAGITQIWDAQVVSHVGSHYVIRGAGWNGTLAGGGTVAFGLIASPGGSTAAPSNYRLNGAPLDGAAPPPATPTLRVDDAAAVEPSSGSTPLAWTVSLSSPSASAATVRYATSNGTAVAGTDYVAASGTLTFAPGETAKTLTTAVLADALVEGDETLSLTLSAPVGATLAKARGAGVIRDAAPAPPPAGGDFSFQVTNDWGGGYNGRITVRNSGRNAWTAWTLEFDYAGALTSVWDAVVVSHVGNHYVVANASYNGGVDPGASASFGFTASPGHPAAGPTNYVVRGGGPVNHAPVAVDDAAWTAPGRPVTTTVLANDADADGDPLKVAAAAQGRHGTTAVGADGAITYTPAAGFTGPDSFTYTISDGRAATATATVTLTVSNLAWPAHVFAPYVDMGLYPTYDLVAAAKSQGLKYFNLAFIVADAGRPSWGGFAAVDGGAFDMAARAQINALRGMGGDVAVSFGGASGSELAQSITDVDALKAAYRTVVDAYGLTRADFDVEGAAVADRASVDRRSQALAGLQRDLAAAGRPLQVWFTLPVLPTGLTPDGLYVVQSALKAGVKLGGVNVMAMDYGDSAAPSPRGRMGDYAIQAATSTFGQLRPLFGAAATDAQIWAMIGVTPMIGLNDVVTETFTQDDARKLLAFADKTGLGQVAIWSLNRDQQNPRGAVNYAEPTSSSIVQGLFEFSLIFKPFTS
ncbi:cellulose binding domain-containing protein [Paludisphaera mucosa]|uniref:Cellulose binding domain-containing protein n=1 Tax=Paludisphaera mucosa TaxID=3030827 RepID=A0ABT6FBZ4_9BACT|nr:cellulose binding domain-containing protein [Paludisphaera mucosa]